MKLHKNNSYIMILGLISVSAFGNYISTKELVLLENWNKTNLETSMDNNACVTSQINLLREERTSNKNVISEKKAAEKMLSVYQAFGK
jgi:hypothetical protein